MSAQRSEPIIFRPAKSEAELEELLRLRYRVYDDSVLRGFISQTELGIDVDAFDLRSHHVGLFRGDQPIGYARLITLARGPQGNWVDAILRRTRHDHSARPGMSLPVLAYAKSARETKIWIERRAKAGFRIAEAGRLSLRNEERSMRLMGFMGHALVGYWVASGFDIAIMGCRLAHSRYWESLGFRGGPATQEAQFNGVSGRVLTLERSDIAPKVQQVVIALTRELEQSGQVVFPSRSSVHGSSERDTCVTRSSTEMEERHVA